MFHVFSESMALSWKEELQKYWSMMEEQTKSILQLVKKDLLKSGLQFDAKFKQTFLQVTNSRYEQNCSNALGQRNSNEISQFFLKLEFPKRLNGFCEMSIVWIHSSIISLPTLVLMRRITIGAMNHMFVIAMSKLMPLFVIHQIKRIQTDQPSLPPQPQLT